MCLSPKLVYRGKKPMLCSCGQCIQCRIQHSLEWSYRIVDETKSHAQNCFVTLTYDDEHLPPNSSLRYRDVQLFLKRLRKKHSDIKIRYFCCGEYGSLHSRPHYHLVLFGYCPEDLRFHHRDKIGINLYTSVELRNLWKNGHIIVGVSVNSKSALYCAKYMQKSTKEFKDENPNRVPSFIRVSTRNGIGYDTINERCLETGSIYREGKSLPIPRYYKKILEKRLCGDSPELIRQFRELLESKHRNVNKTHINDSIDKGDRKLFEKYYDNYKNKIIRDTEHFERYMPSYVNKQEIEENLKHIFECMHYNCLSTFNEDAPRTDSFCYWSHGAYTQYLRLLKEQNVYDKHYFHPRSKHDTNNTRSVSISDNSIIEFNTKLGKKVYAVEDEHIPDFGAEPKQLKFI